MLSLKSFHLFFMFASIVLAAGFGTWCVMHGFMVVGVAAIAVGILLVGYETYFAVKTEKRSLS